MSKLARSIAILLIFAVVAAAQPPAQDWNTVKIMTTGTEVRINLASGTVRGQIQGVTDDALTMYSGKGSQTIMRSEILRLSIKKHGHRGRNVLIGLAAGAGAGAVIGAASTHGCTGFCIFQVSKGEAAGFGALVFGAIGAVVGAVIPTGGWQEVYRK